MKALELIHLAKLGAVEEAAVRVDDAGEIEKELKKEFTSCDWYYVKQLRHNESSWCVIVDIDEEYSVVELEKRPGACPCDSAATTIPIRSFLDIDKIVEIVEEIEKGKLLKVAGVAAVSPLQIIYKLKLLNYKITRHTYRSCISAELCKTVGDGKIATYVTDCHGYDIIFAAQRRPKCAHCSIFEPINCR